MKKNNPSIFGTIKNKLSSIFKRATEEAPSRPETPCPVLVIPGFMNNDTYMTPLRSKISAQGYKTYGWGYGMNTGADKKAAEHLEKRLKEIYEENGQVPVSIVGYSLGGVYARELARKHPDLVRHVITLSAPFGLKDDRVLKIHELFHGEALGEKNINQVMTVPPPVSTTSIYSKKDKIVDWQTCLNAAAQNACDIEVDSGHIAMPFKDDVHQHIFDILSKAKATNTPRAVHKADSPNFDLDE